MGMHAPNASAKGVASNDSSLSATRLSLLVIGCCTSHPQPAKTHPRGYARLVQSMSETRAQILWKAPKRDRLHDDLFIFSFSHLPVRKPNAKSLD
jgi:hypothetical protein